MKKVDLNLLIVHVNSKIGDISSIFEFIWTIKRFPYTGNVGVHESDSWMKRFNILPKDSLDFGVFNL